MQEKSSKQTIAFIVLVNSLVILTILCFTYRFFLIVYFISFSWTLLLKFYEQVFKVFLATVMLIDWYYYKIVLLQNGQFRIRKSRKKFYNTSFFGCYCSAGRCGPLCPVYKTILVKSSTHPWNVEIRYL